MIDAQIIDSDSANNFIGNRRVLGHSEICISYAKDGYEADTADSELDTNVPAVAMEFTNVGISGRSRLFLVMGCLTFLNFCFR